MSIGLHRYGKIRDNYKFEYDALRSMKARINKYKETGCLDYLIDAANFLMIEFMLPSHENPTREAPPSEDSPGIIDCNGRPNKAR